jgi:protein-S-isoprenylcysteine O-methyltransferase Ste14
MSTAGSRRWRGARGEWFVVAQAALIALVVFGPRTVLGFPGAPFPLGRPGEVAGAVLMLLGGGLFVAAMFRLGSALTPLPYPRDGATLVQAGPYRWVRHPIYASVLASALGWALLVQGWLTLGYVGLLFIFFDVKSRKEERWLSERYPEYEAYRRRVRKLVPFVY